jgi:hypothetical protein
MHQIAQPLVIVSVPTLGQFTVNRLYRAHNVPPGFESEWHLFYLPIIFDFERPMDRELAETVKILAGLSAFVIADITNPRSVPLELQATVPDYMVPFVTILQEGQPAFSMFDDLPRKYHWVLPLLEYSNPERLLALRMKLSSLP